MKFFIPSFLFFSFLIYSCSGTEKKQVVVQPTKANIDSLLNLYPDSIGLLVFRGNEALKEYRFYDALADGGKSVSYR